MDFMRLWNPGLHDVPAGPAVALFRGIRDSDQREVPVAPELGRLLAGIEGAVRVGAGVREGAAEGRGRGGGRCIACGIMRSRRG